MNNDTTDLEGELLCLQPPPASPRVERALALALDLPDGAASAGVWWRRLGFVHPFSALAWGLGLPAATALAMLFFHAPRSAANLGNPAVPELPCVAQRSVVPPRLKPPESADVFSQTSDQGIVYAGGRPNKRLRIRSKDTVAWRSPGTQLEVSCPREAVVLVPIQVF